jgi:hypothetical protein
MLPLMDKPTCFSRGYYDFYILKNTIYNANNIGIDVIGFEDSGMKYQPVTGVIEDNSVYNIDTRGHNNDGEGGYITDPLIRRNLAYKNTKNKGFTDESASCIYIDGAKDVRILRNKVSYCNLGISVASEHDGTNRNKAAQEITVANNLIHHISASGLKLGSGDIDSDGVTGCWILNNTFYKNDLPDTTADDWHDGAGEVWIEYNTYNCRIINNIFVANSENNVIVSNTRSTSTGTGGNNNDFERNHYYAHVNNIGISELNAQCGWGADANDNMILFDYKTCVDPVNKMFSDGSAKYGDPKLESSTYKLIATSSSLLMNRGLSVYGSVNLLDKLGVTDVYGGPRINGTVDIGADER